MKKFYNLGTSLHIYLPLKLPISKITEFANSVDPDEAAHNELPHPGLHSLPSIL